MTLEDIKAAVDAGQAVTLGPIPATLSIRTGSVSTSSPYLPNGSCIGLTDREGATVERKSGGVQHRAIGGTARKISGSQSRPGGQGEGRSTRKARGQFPPRWQALTRGRGLNRKSRLSDS